MGKRRSVGACLLAVAALVLQVVALGRGEESASGGLLDPRELEKFVDELPDMPRLRGYGVAEGGGLVAGNLTIGMYDTTWKFHRDLPATRVFAYGASKDAATVPGPTIEAMQGVPTHVTWTNHLPARHFLPWDPTLTTATPGRGVPTVVHLHGGVQHSSSDGHSLAWFTSGFSVTGPHFSAPPYEYPNRQPPGNLWYHDHAMGLTRVNILAGLMGAYRVASPAEEDPLNLPSGEVFDRNLVLFDRDFLANGSLFMNRTGNNPSVHPQWQPEYFGAVVVVNGKAWPYLRVRRRRYRFRILNASNARFFRLSLTGGLRFVHIASDSVYLARPVATDKFLVAPSEIIDVVVDFAASSADAAILSDDAPAPYPGDPGEKAETVAVMKFLIAESTEPDPSSLPATLMPHYPRADAREASTTRHITMYEYTKNGTDEPTHLYLNALSYMDPVTETPREGTAEIWDVINLTDDNHPLHLHLVLFAVLEQRSLRRVDEFRDCMVRRNDARVCGLDRHLAGGRRHVVPRQERGWKNVFKVRPSAVTRMLVRFKPLSAASPPSESRFHFDVTTGPGYVYHCHILDHEDNEMMRPMKIVR
ncbi:multicopper oxidase LPR1 homolog 2-like [Phragmites australis]|uniref:multicopper oxidase LPR1 homolog 2-like n=1 Tax=Phragmites australis TaxID=29695 RepID=UPI002D77B1DF|nr:multicopper oxidase LPR1 homolog 2-like [Phragmites australis]